MSWRIVFTKQAQKDAQKLSVAGLRTSAQKLLEVLAENPLQFPPHSNALSATLRAPIRGESISIIGWYTRYSKNRRS